MTAVGRTKMFAQFIEADVHQHYGIDGVYAVPWIDPSMRASTCKVELGTDQSVILQTVAGGRTVGDMRNNRRIDVFEISLPDDVRAAHELLFRWTKRERNGPGDLVLFHRFLNSVGGTDRDRRHNVVSFHVARRAFDERLSRDRTGSL